MRTVLTTLALITSTSIADPSSQPPGDAPDQIGAFSITVPGSAVKMVFVPVDVPDGAPPLWVARDETTWDLYDAMVYRLDQEDPAVEPTDGLTRPTKPYIMADRGWGHAGHPALSVSSNGARAFCTWLGAKVDGSFRIPTVEEWTRLAKTSGVTPETLDDHAWHKGNSRRKTQKVTTKKADANGLHDLHGNVSEWCQVEVGPETDMVLMGGHFKQTAEFQTPTERKEPTPAWNDTDPQIPKSIWWLSDAPFAGFRVACTRPPSGAAPLPTKDEHSR
ncbi:MAG: SUMF1/EgtB/PvdO family nonheme iron enzyme [Phycisphaerales bacterium]|nr:SUMF1/EgtB/PvdO family nonheme iron enzyme [Phycisphaerales bacterium]